MKIAVLLATYNRKEKTVSCLQRLYDQELREGVSIEVFLTDDNSTDGTRAAIRQHFPRVRIFKGSGSLFWAGGMRNSWKNARTVDPDYYLLLNDDTLLTENAVERILAYYDVQGKDPDTIAIGSTMEYSNQVVSYGGRKLYHPKKVQSYIAYSETEYLDCDMANANIMMVTRQIVHEIGMLSECYTHSIADFDYTLRAKKAGFKTVVMPGVLGNCIDDHGYNWSSSEVSLKNRLKYLKSPKGLAYKEYMGFIRQHFPSHIAEAFIKLWLKTLFPVLWDKFKTRD